MLPGASVPASLAGLLSGLAGCFTAPTFRTFQQLLVGLVGASNRRTVCGMWISTGMSAVAHHCRAHRFFSCARWSADGLGLAVSRLAADRLLPAGADVVVAVDDTLFLRYGRKVHAAAWQHDGSAAGPRKIGFGNCFVVAGLVVRLPMLTRPVCLPVLFRLWIPKAGTSKTEHAVALARLLAEGLPGSRVHVVADAAYHGPACRDLPGNVTWTCRLARNAVLYAPAPPRTGRRGRPALKGPRLGTPAELAAGARWHAATVTRYGRTDTVHAALVDCLWYGAFRATAVRVLLVRDPGADTGYDPALVTTDPDAAAADLVGRYADRWSIEVVNLEAKHVLGVGQARNRLPRAVERTVPFGLLAMTLVVLWYAEHGHHPDDLEDRRARAPWYTTKTEPAFEDMLVKLRRTIIAARFAEGSQAPPTPQQTLAVQQAWAAAAA